MAFARPTVSRSSGAEPGAGVYIVGVAAAGAEAADDVGRFVGRKLHVGAGLAGRGLFVVDPDAERAHQERATGRS